MKAHPGRDPVPPASLTATYQALPFRPADGFARVSQVLMRQLAGGFPPAAGLHVCTSAGPWYTAAGGWSVLAQPPDSSIAADDGTLFDLASLTKVVATLPLVLLLHQRGQLSIDDPVSRWLPGAPTSPVTISDCLLHTAGLVPHRPYYEMHQTPADIKRAVIGELADARPGPVSYSDLGFMLLGWAAEACADEPLDRLVSREVLAPLGMTATSYLPSVPVSRIAATEQDGYERSVRGLAWGTVHDGNAFALGGISGHAGLFGPVGDLGRYAAALLRPAEHPVLSAETIALMTTRQAGAGGEKRVLGWRLHPENWGRWPAGTLWHTGFTGTSLLIAPDLDVAVALLTNAVHPVRRPAEMPAPRGRIHREVRAAVRSADVQV